MLGREQYQHWLSIAGRHSRRPSDAEDLLQDAVLAAIRAGRRDLNDEDNAAWFAGVIRNLAKMAARSATRRRTRETVRATSADSVGAATIHRADAVDELDAFLLSVSATLPRAARAVAVLALAGLDRREIANVLKLSDAALRQRLSTIRRAWQKLDPAIRAAGVPRPRSTIRTKLELGTMRQALFACFSRAVMSERTTRTDI